MGIDERTRARFVAGDPLRAIAALGVMFGHTFAYSLSASGYPELIGQAVPGIGWLMWPVAAGPELVYLFFALSGYLIGRPFIRAFVEGTHYPSPLRYLKHRILRIVPAYWVVLTICLLVITVPSKPLGPILEAYFFLLDWYQSPIEGVLSQAWTLRVEMRFYLMLPIVAAVSIWLAGKAGPRLSRTFRCWIVILMAAAWGIGCSFITDGEAAFLSGSNVIHTAFAFAPGLLFAGVELLPIRQGILRSRVAPLIAGALVLFAASLWVYPWWMILNTSMLEHQIRQMILLTMIFGGLLFWQWSGRRTWRVLDNPVLRWTGSRSYGIYLLHLLVLYVIADDLAYADEYKRTFAVLFPATIIVTGVAAEVLYRLVERPALKLKDVPVRQWVNLDRIRRFRSPDRNSKRVRAMFNEMVIPKDISKVSEFYHPDFRLFTNGQEQGYAEFVSGHEVMYESEIAYEVEYDEASWVEDRDSVSVRLWITTTRPGEEANRIEVVLIAKFREGKIHRLWELTWPDWSALKTFEKYEIDQP